MEIIHEDNPFVISILDKADETPVALLEHIFKDNENLYGGISIRSKKVIINLYENITIEEIKNDKTLDNFIAYIEQTEICRDALGKQWVKIIKIGLHRYSSEVRTLSPENANALCYIGFCAAYYFAYDEYEYEYENIRKCYIINKDVFAKTLLDAASIHAMKKITYDDFMQLMNQHAPNEVGYLIFYSNSSILVFLIGFYLMCILAELQYIKAYDSLDDIKRRPIFLDHYLRNINELICKAKDYYNFIGTDKLKDTNITNIESLLKFDFIKENI